ncbi:MAG: DUF1080 domain-containing protein [Bryobacterales bacterium]|nr:DUF1080 domain-containing protein [Bryobacterales bacterium]
MPGKVSRLLVLPLLLAPALTLAATSPFVGRWGFDLTLPNGLTRGAWLGISEKAGGLDVWYQPTGGNVYQITDFKVTGSRLTMTVAKASKDRPATVWELDAAGGGLTGVQNRGGVTVKLTAIREPALNHKPPKAWSRPEPLFNGKDLTGWEPLGDPSKSHWMVKDGLLVNEAHGANLRTTRKFNDLKVHFEVKCPERANSGFYLRGRYEIQLEYESLDFNPPERRMGSIYGRIAPTGNVPRTPGQWESFDATLVGRTLTLVHNGVTTIDHQQIEGITGGALDADEALPGPFYIQGDHTGGLMFRNITVSVPKR